MFGGVEEAGGREDGADAGVHFGEPFGVFFKVGGEGGVEPGGSIGPKAVLDGGAFFFEEADVVFPEVRWEGGAGVDAVGSFHELLGEKGADLGLGGLGAEQEHVGGAVFGGCRAGGTGEVADAPAGVLQGLAEVFFGDPAVARGGGKGGFGEDCLVQGLTGLAVALEQRPAVGPGKAEFDHCGREAVLLHLPDPFGAEGGEHAVECKVLVLPLAHEVDIFNAGFSVLFEAFSVEFEEAGALLDQKDCDQCEQEESE